MEMTLKVNSPQQSTATFSPVERFSQPAGRPAQIRIRCAFQHLEMLPASIKPVLLPLAIAELLIQAQPPTFPLDAPSRVSHAIVLAAADEEEDDEEDLDEEDDDELEDDEDVEEDDEEDFDEDDDEPEYDDEDDDVIDDEADEDDE